jgi:hypothetical protein
MTFTANSFAQVYWDKYPYGQFKTIKLVPTYFNIEKENIFIYSKNFVDIYFKQSDIKAYIFEAIKRDTAIAKIDKELLDLLSENRKEIWITDLLYDLRTKKETDNLRLTKKIEQFNDRITGVIEFIGADLIYEGKFMIYSPADKRFIYKGLKGKRLKGQLGNRYYIYVLPGGKAFYSIVTALGE